jgi:uncharacterized membrane protein HdeD (DUF308 family)
MLREMAKNWWMLLLRGIVPIAFGVLAFIWPGLTLITLVVVYGVYAIIDGLLALISAVIGGAPAPRWWLAVIGLLGVATGILTFARPGITALVLVFLIAGWAITVGIFQINGASRLRKETANEWFLILCGIISVLFGIRYSPCAGRGRACSGMGDRLLRRPPRHSLHRAGLPPEKTQLTARAATFGCDPLFAWRCSLPACAGQAYEQVRSCDLLR